MANNDLKDRLERIANSNAERIVNENIDKEVEETEEDINYSEYLSDEIEEDLEEPIIIQDNDESVEKIDYRKLLADDYKNMDEDDIESSRKEAIAFIKDEEQKEAIPERKKSRAELFEEKHAIINKSEKKEVVDDLDDDPNAEIIRGMEEMDKNNVILSAQLQKMQEEYVSTKEDAIDSQDDMGDDVDSILNKLEENNVRKDLDIEEDNEDLSLMIEKLENDKTYSKYDEPEEVTGPADYVVEDNRDYQDVVESVLDENNIKVVKASNSEKNAVLDKFSNYGANVTVPLVNSGIYVTLSGASVPEIISMNSITGSSNAETILAKLKALNGHIIGSSIGKMRLSQLVKVVSYYDIETIYYALYAATYPDESEINRACGRCGSDYYIKANTRHLLLNSEDFAKEAGDIRDNVTTYAKLLETTVLNRVVKKTLMDGNVIVYLKHPSIESYINTDNRLNPDALKNYQSTLIDICYSVDKLLLRKRGNEYVEFKDPNTIIDVLQKLKNEDLMYELLDAIEEIRPNALPSFGYRKTVCPHCGYSEPQQSFSIQDLLFTSAQQKSEMATLRWAAKLQKRRQQKKK